MTTGRRSGGPGSSRSTGRGPALWLGDTLTAEVYVDRRDGPPRTVSFSVSRRGAVSEAEHASLRDRLRALADALGGRLWDDDLEDFVR